MFEKRLLQSEQGVALLQAAIVLPVVIAFLVAIVDFGFALNQHLMFTRAVHEGTIFAARRPVVAGDFEAVTNTAIEQRIRNALQSYSLNTAAPSVMGIDVNDSATLIIDEPVYTANSAPASEPPNDTVSITARLTYRGFFMRDLQMSITTTAPYMRIS